jgi:hypothetical protein
MKLGKQMKFVRTAQLDRHKDNFILFWVMKCDLMEHRIEVK